jgi:hypothetical protein
MKVVHELGIEPDLVYVDAAHDTPSVVKDIETAMKYFPRGHLRGRP